jgi:hypothetical protein
MAEACAVVHLAGTCDDRTRVGGTWSDPQPRGAAFAADPAVVKNVFAEISVSARWQRTVSFTSDVFPAAVAADGTNAAKPRLSIAQLRAVLRKLIMLELTDRGSAVSRGLEGVMFVTGGCVSS